MMVICTSAVSYLNSSAREAGAAAEFAASRKTAKYVSLAASHLFFPIAVETQGPLSEEARQLLCDLGRRISKRQNTAKTRTSGKRCGSNCTNAQAHGARLKNKNIEIIYT